MKQWIGLALLVFVGTAGWRIGHALSPDALSMAVGVLFGVMAGVPTAILVMAGSRRRNVEEASTRERQRASMQSYFPQHAQHYTLAMRFSLHPPTADGSPKNALPATSPSSANAKKCSKIDAGKQDPLGRR
jgi:hypothetical protein